MHMFSACEKERFIEVSAVTIDHTKIEINVGETSQLVADIQPINATDKKPTWRSSNQSVATVSDSGLVTGITEGTAIISASVSEKTADCRVTVNPAYVAVSSLSFAEETYELRDDEKITLDVTISPSNATNKSIIWSISDNSIADVSNGVITAKKVGEAVVTATSEDGNKTSSCKLSVTSSLITFADKYVKLICVQKYDTNGDNEISYKEAAVPTFIERNFFGDAYRMVVTSFDEFKYFTSVESVYNEAFSYSSLTSIEFPPNVTHIGNSALCNEKLTSIKLNEGLISIGEFAFQSCFALKNLELPSTLTHIGRCAFQIMTSLSTLTIPNKVSTIPEGLLAGSAIKSIEIGSGVTKISDYAFGDCENLEELTIPNSVKEIGHGIVYGCKNLSKINSSYSLDNGRCIVIAGVMEGFAPAGLSEYTIPSSVSAIGERVFSSLSDLKEVTIPESIVSIGKEAFGWCTGLKILNMNPPTPPYLCSESFVDNSTEKIEMLAIYVPTESVEAYKTADIWSKFASIIKPKRDK